jgi:transcriptional regulator of acetoin/glycerol metabolism
MLETSSPERELNNIGLIGAVERPTREWLARMRSTREHFIADPVGTDLSQVRDVIARSWRRSAACHVDPESIPTEVRDVQIDTPMLNIALPVVERLAGLARDTGASVVLADSAGTIAAMRGDKAMLEWADARFSIIGAHMPEELAGTNSDGTALEEGASVQVWGPEHYAEGLQETFCTSVLIQDALRRRVAGVITLMVPQQVAFDTDPGALALIVEGAAAEINRSAVARLADREQALLTAYLRESRMRGAGAVLAIDERTTIASNRAQQILTPDDYAVLSAYAREAVTSGGSFDRLVSLTGDRSIKLMAKAVIADGDVVGAVVRLREQSEPTSDERRDRDTRVLPGVVGDSAVMARVRAEASSALELRNAVCVTGERGTGRTHLARLMAEASPFGWRELEGDPERSQGLDLLAGLRDAAEAAEVVVLPHLDLVPEAVLQEGQDLLRTTSSSGRLIATAHQLTQGLLDVLDGSVPAEIKLPPLRSRRDDIPALVTQFLASEAGARSLAPSGKLLQALAHADWPGNVAALRTAVVSAAKNATSNVVDVSDLGELQQQAIARGRLSRLEAAELEQLRHALAEARGNRVRAAELLEIGRSTLYRKIDSYTRRGYDLGG